MNSLNVTLYPDSLKLAVIGDPVLHSLSPLIHNTMLATLGLRAVYMAQTVKTGQLEDWLRHASMFGWGGFNATMPHKSALVPLMDSLSADASLHAAVNTVVIRDGRLHGHNTDGQGFIRALEAAGIMLCKRKVVVLGAGGAARSIAWRLLSSGVQSVTIACRRPEAAQKLFLQLPLRDTKDRLRLIPLGPFTALGEQAEERNSLPAELSTGMPTTVSEKQGAELGAELTNTLPNSLSDALMDCDLLINATPLGMHGSGQDFANFTWLNALPSHAVVCDLIYSPAHTPLLRAAAGRGLITQNGMAMLIHQAILALELFMNQPIPHERVLPALYAALHHVQGKCS